MEKRKKGNGECVMGFVSLACKHLHCTGIYTWFRIDCCAPHCDDLINFVWTDHYFLIFINWYISVWIFIWAIWVFSLIFNPFCTQNHNGVLERRPICDFYLKIKKINFQFDWKLKKKIFVLILNWFMPILIWNEMKIAKIVDFCKINC